MGTSTLRCLVTERAEKFTFVLILIFFSACQPILPKPSVATTTSQTFLTAWETRLDKYREDFVVKDTAIRKKSGDTLQTEIASSPDPWKSLVSSVFELSVMIREAFTTAGRGETLKAFIKHMETHPSLGLSDIWFLQQADDVQSQARIVDEKTKTFFATFDQKVRKNAEWILEIEQLAREQGMLAGENRGTSIFAQASRNLLPRYTTGRSRRSASSRKTSQSCSSAIRDGRISQSTELSTATSKFPKSPAHLHFFCKYDDLQLADGQDGGNDAQQLSNYAYSAHKLFCLRQHHPHRLVLLDRRVIFAQNALDHYIKRSIKPRHFSTAS